MRVMKISTVIILLLVAALYMNRAKLVVAKVQGIQLADIKDMAENTVRKFEKTFAASSGGTLKVNTEAGSIKVIGTSANEVSVVCEMDGKEKDLDNFEVTAVQTSQGVEVRGTHKKTGWLSQLIQSWSMNAVYTIRVPQTYNVNLSTSGGDLTIETLKGTVQGQTSGGDVNISKIEGEVKLETSGGDMKAEQVKGNVNFETSGGSLKLTDITGNVAAQTSGGNVNILGCDGEVKAETSGGNVTIIVKSAKPVYAESSGGNIDIQIPASMPATIDAETSGGGVTCDFPTLQTHTSGKRFDNSAVSGTINGGGAKIHAHTSGGNVSIHPL
jgi:DUF4097 and DUF4098 domain-containing protein YvlB